MSDKKEKKYYKELGTGIEEQIEKRRQAREKLERKVKEMKYDTKSVKSPTYTSPLDKDQMKTISGADFRAKLAAKLKDPNYEKELNYKKERIANMPDKTYDAGKYKKEFQQMQKAERKAERKAADIAKKAAKKLKGAAKMIPIIGPAIGAGMALQSDDATAAIPLLNMVDPVGSDPAIEDPMSMEYKIRNSQAKKDAMKKRAQMEALMKMRGMK